MNELKRRQFAFNAETRDGWEDFASHRMSVTELLKAGGDPAKSRLCVLGAGNCNDLDLTALLGAHREVHLVDLDGAALAAGVSRQGISGHPSLRIFGDIDVTGMLDSVVTWTPDCSIGPQELAACVDRPIRLVGPALPGPYDLVASTCILSQIIGSVMAAVGEAHPRFVDLVQAIRMGHLLLLAHMAASGGEVALITDVVSTDSCPALGSCPESALPGLLTQLARERNFFHGVNPVVLGSVIARDPVLGMDFSRPETVAPWRWNLGPRLYLVWALRWRRNNK